MNEVQEFTRAQRIWAGIGLVLMFLIVGGSAAFQSFNHITQGLQQLDVASRHEVGQRRRRRRSDVAE